jgi:hypothetical protein
MISRQSKELLKEKMAELSIERMQEVTQAIAYALDLKLK